VSPSMTVQVIAAAAAAAAAEEEEEEVDAHPESNGDRDLFRLW